MSRRIVLLITLSQLLCFSIAAGETERAEKRLNGLFQSFMAPCCWHENLSIHRSPTAEAVREQIREMVTAGFTDEQIKAALVKEHTIRILALPEGAKGKWLSWIPLAALSIGLMTVVFAIRRMLRRRNELEAPVADAPVAEVDEAELEADTRPVRHAG